METTDTTRFVNLNTYAESRPVEGDIVTVLDGRHEQRGIKLISSYSRAVPRYSIHELIATDERDKKPGDTLDRISYLAFFEVVAGGCLLVGQTVHIGGLPVGHIIGFDETHEPNHLNIIISVSERKTGRELDLHPGFGVRFELQR